MIKWEEEVALIEEQINKGVTLEDVGEYYGVSRQRIYQVINQYNIETVNRKRTRLLEEFDDPRYYWVNRLLVDKDLSRVDRLSILKEIEVPDVCPCLGTNIDWSSKGTRSEDSPSIDKLIPKDGYTKDNIYIISWRANRIKNDGNYKELLAIGAWVKSKVKS